MWTDLKSYVQSSAQGQTWSGDDAFLEQCWEEAAELVTKHVGAASVPDAIFFRATLEVGSELYNRRAAPNGIVQFADFNAPAIRIARDPMVGAYPLLRPYMGPGIA
jgi:hypothetical protein